MTDVTELMRAEMMGSDHIADKFTDQVGQGGLRVPAAEVASMSVFRCFVRYWRHQGALVSISYQAGFDCHGRGVAGFEPVVPAMILNNLGSWVLIQ